MECPKHSADTMVRHLESVYPREIIQEMQRYNVSSISLLVELACPITLTDILAAIQLLPPNKVPGGDHYCSNYAGNSPMFTKVDVWLK
ncbi:hypothetical protein RO3G_09782 [Rhizopus delemar RA 99-880]|uniref:Uncharacterized protein n=1 Tax=Rhizopus delemar (strain RA 99-880 / ATCC MYA-4621 / FGSC 9543 / NRRL 43880) TaxID=246409 RepID=I1C9E2_RHIO9|nr:hypothetical protein RO3G_09782 [Rhizopus delemar RA 99-880]|eukprot:EIE85072.1 hypothetical protein RO3G_09782 [Rhizopus delemar RA 99-880]